MKENFPTFSSVGREDVDLGAMLGTSTFDVDKKLQKQPHLIFIWSFAWCCCKNEKIPFYDDKGYFL